MSFKDWIKYAYWPGTNWVGREKSLIADHFLDAPEGRRLRTLDCGCGNLYFSWRAWKKGSDVTGVTISEGELARCGAMRDYLGIPEPQIRIVKSGINDYLDGREEERGTYDQVILLDCLEHIRDDIGTIETLHALLNDHGFIYITVPSRDFNWFLNRRRESREENGWHVRNGYTLEQLERLLEHGGFEPLDRLRFGNVGSNFVWWLQIRVFRRLMDPLTILLHPLLALLTWVGQVASSTHTIGVVARKRSTGERTVHGTVG